MLKAKKETWDVEFWPVSTTYKTHAALEQATDQLLLF